MKLTKFLTFIHTDDSGDKITVSMRYPTSSELSRHLNARFPRHGKIIKTQIVEARVAFAQSLLINVKGVTLEGDDGSVVTVDRDLVLSDDDKKDWSAALRRPVENWMDLFPSATMAAWAIKVEGEKQGFEFEEEDDKESAPLA